MKVLLAGGGTAGHINPALAIAEEILKHQPQSKVLFVGNADGMEKNMVEAKGYPFASMQVKGFQRKPSFDNLKRNLKALYYLAGANGQAKKILTTFQPNLVIGTGGYVSGPIVRCAANMGIKTIIHEQNAFPGVTTKILSKYVDKILLGTPKAVDLLAYPDKCIATGNPIRESIIYTETQKAREIYGVKNRICILSFGGSLGAEVLNKHILKLMKWSVENKKEVLHLHATGALGYDAFFQGMKEMNLSFSHPNLVVRKYIEDMDTCLAACDFVITRAGAITLSEIAAAGKGAILIPSPNVSENHQYHNGMVIQEAQAGVVIQEKELTEKKLIHQVEQLLQDKELLKHWSNQAYTLAHLDANQKIYEIIKEII